MEKRVTGTLLGLGLGWGLGSAHSQVTETGTQRAPEKAPGVREAHSGFGLNPKEKEQRKSHLVPGNFEKLVGSVVPRDRSHVSWGWGRGGAQGRLIT